MLGYWVPRTRYNDKTIRNESTKGCDIIGFKILKEGVFSNSDTLAIFEGKAQLTGDKADSRLQDAVQDSMKDITRKPESLNAIKQRYLDKKQNDFIWRVERFQNPEDRPYKELSGACCIPSSNCYNPELIAETDASSHPNKDNLFLMVIYGNDMMTLVHELYKRAADEA